MDNNKITITLPKQLWDDVNVELERQKDKLKEMSDAKLCVLFKQYNQYDGSFDTTFSSYPDNDSFREAVGDMVLPTAAKLIESSSLQKEIRGLKKDISDADSVIKALHDRIKNYNELPWWRKIFTFSL